MRKGILLLVLLLQPFLGLQAENEDAQMMVHLLDYIAVDYSMAVNDGEVINTDEFGEMMEFSKTIKTLGVKAPAAIQSDIDLLEELIRDKAPQQKVNSVATSIKQQLISHFKLATAPKRWPNIENGRSLYALHCKSCHGEEGRGEGVLAAGLSPRPTNFREEDKAHGLSPYQAYNTIRLGVDNTAMRAFDELNDDEAWDLAFYILSFAHQSRSKEVEELAIDQAVNLDQLASLNNQELAQALGLTGPDALPISALRLHPKEIAEQTQGNYLNHAKKLLQQAVTAYQKGETKEARTLALSAYLEGVEPVEIQLQAADKSFSLQVENQLAEVRSLIEAGGSVAELETAVSKSISMLDDAQKRLNSKTFSPWLAFLLSASIILREGLEAFLVVITMLSIVRVTGIKKAKGYIHGGWVLAVLSGIAMWYAAGKLFDFSGANRELMEGLIALFAVAILLYVGFWMHSKSEAGKWQAYIKERITKLGSAQNLLGLAFLSFLVVFREAFESVLFLSALNLEVGEAQQGAFGAGVIFAFVMIALIGVLMMKYAKRLPIPKLFRYSAMIISVLAIILTGKGIAAIQEAGLISLSLTPFNIRLDAIGLYPTWETLLSQLAISLLVVGLWTYQGRQNAVKKTAEA